MIDDDLCCKCTAYRPLRICCLDGLFHSPDVLYTAVIERCTKADDKNFVLSDAVLVEAVIKAGISSIPSKIVRICIFTAHHFFLNISKPVPFLLCQGTLRICL